MATARPDSSGHSLRLATAIIRVLDAGVDRDDTQNSESITFWQSTSRQLVSWAIQLQKFSECYDSTVYQQFVVNTLAFLSRDLIVQHVETNDMRQWTQLLLPVHESCSHAALVATFLTFCFFLLRLAMSVILSSTFIG